MTELRHGRTGAENRRFPRLRVTLGVQYKRLERGHHPMAEQSWLQDLGAGGMAMHGEEELDQDQLLMVTLYLPPAVAAPEQLQPNYSERESTPVNILSRVAWCATHAEGGFVCGVQFLDLDRDDRQRLKHFLVEYHLDSPESQLYS